MITDDDAEKAADYIKNNAIKFAQAKAERVYLEGYGKSLKAILTTHYEGSVAAKENLAYADDKYLEHLKELRQAVLEEEKLKGLISAAECKIKVWQSINANQRGRI